VLLARLAPGDHLSEFELTPAQIAAERHRLGLDAPLHVQYVAWLRRFARFDLGESTRYPGRRVRDLIAERIGNTLLLGGAALVIATALGIPLGVVSGRGGRDPLALATGGLSVILLALPPVVLSLGLLFLASKTGWFPVGGLPPTGGVSVTLQSLALPVLALGLPSAATLERLQSRAMADALRHPSIQAARARGIPSTRLVWSHALRLSLTPVLAVYGVIAATLISGSFAVEYVMTWPGLGRLLYDGLIARDANVVAGCAATGAAVLAIGIFFADVALAAVDPRVADPR
jgi:ABC-type dipeptide/oligopeptide/nickel transport system permease component